MRDDDVFAWCEGDVYAGNRPHAASRSRSTCPRRWCSSSERRARTTSPRSSKRRCARTARRSRRVRRRAPRPSRTRLPGRADRRGWVRLRRHARRVASGARADHRRASTATARSSTSAAPTDCSWSRCTRWCIERGHRARAVRRRHRAGLVARARLRLPQWADRIWLGDAATWVPPGRPALRLRAHAARRASRPNGGARSVAHVLDHVVAPGGRMLVERLRRVPATRPLRREHPPRPRLRRHRRVAPH